VDLDPISNATELVRLDLPKNRLWNMEPEFLEDGSVIVNILLMYTCVVIIEVGIDDLIVRCDDVQKT
jgi:hypothetical protein